MQRDPAAYAAAILNAAWMVRAARQEAAKARAIHAMGEVCREAFNACGDDYRPILRALVDGLTDERERRPII